MVRWTAKDQRNIYKKKLHHKSIKNKNKAKTIKRMEQEKNKKQMLARIGINRMLRRAGNHKIKKRMHGDSILHARAQHEKGQSLERVWYITTPASQPITPPDRNLGSAHVNSNWLKHIAVHQAK